MVGPRGVDGWVDGGDGGGPRVDACTYGSPCYRYTSSQRESYGFSQAHGQDSPVLLGLSSNLLPVVIEVVHLPFCASCVLVSGGATSLLVRRSSSSIPAMLAATTSEVRFQAGCVFFMPVEVRLRRCTRVFMSVLAVWEVAEACSSAGGWSCFGPPPGTPVSRE